MPLDMTVYNDLDLNWEAFAHATNWTGENDSSA